MVNTAYADQAHKPKNYLPNNYLTNNYPANNNQPQQTLRIAVASNFAPVLRKFLPEFTRQTNIQTQIISGATGVLFQQIKHGAPFDVFLAADSRRPQQLSADNLIVANSLKTYAVGQIAFWSSNLQESKTLSLNKLASGQIKPTRFAIANPDIAPYGKAAKQALIALNLWQHYQTKLIKGININQTFQQIRSQAVTLGIVAHSQLKINGLSGILIPQEYYHPIKQQLVILRTSKNKNQAQQLSSFLLSKQIQQKIGEFGYAVENLKRKNIKSNHLKGNHLKDNHLKDKN
ncbi:MAG: molybdate ABC transporter substrate-binding protein [Alteromonadaceae bacterium]|nr:molybdate ABC transporter substrate-binding protein [Alteromonadaceae bacterium]